MRNIFLSGDHHFGHKNILRFCDRPFPDIWTHDKELIRRWNEIIPKDSITYYVGDLCFRSAKDIGYYKERLNGKIILLRGNHDKQKTLREFKWYQTLPIIIGEFTCLLNHRPAYRKDDPDPYHDNDPGIDPDMYDFIISGHTHKPPIWRWKSLNVGVDLNNYYPWHIDQIYAMLKTRQKELQS